MADSAREPDGRDRPHARDRATEQGSNWRASRGWRRKRRPGPQAAAQGSPCGEPARGAARCGCRHGGWAVGRSVWRGR